MANSVVALAVVEGDGFSDDESSASDESDDGDDHDDYNDRAVADHESAALEPALRPQRHEAGLGAYGNAPVVTPRSPSHPSADIATRQSSHDGSSLHAASTCSSEVIEGDQGTDHGDPRCASSSPPMDRRRRRGSKRAHASMHSSLTRVSSPPAGTGTVFRRFSDNLGSAGLPEGSWNGA